VIVLRANPLRQMVWLAAKDLRIEARTRQTLGLVLILGILVVTVLGLGLGPQRASGPAAAAVLWVAYLFTGVLCFEKTMALERQDGAMTGLLLAPVDRGVIYAAKLCSNLVLMLAVAAVITPVGIVFFSFDLSAAPIGFLAIVALSMLGFAAVGTLFSAVVSSSRLQGGFLALAVFPLTLPLVLTSTRLMTRLYEDGQPFSGSAFAVLLAFDAIFLAVSWVAFEWVLEP
jgi:heme exporter protein CcmB